MALWYLLEAMPLPRSSGWLAHLPGFQATSFLSGEIRPGVAPTIWWSLLLDIAILSLTLSLALCLFRVMEVQTLSSPGARCLYSSDVNKFQLYQRSLWETSADRNWESSVPAWFRTIFYKRQDSFHVLLYHPPPTKQALLFFRSGWIHGGVDQQAFCSWSFCCKRKLDWRCANQVNARHQVDALHTSLHRASTAVKHFEHETWVFGVTKQKPPSRKYHPHTVLHNAGGVFVTGVTFLCTNLLCMDITFGGFPSGEPKFLARSPTSFSNASSDFLASRLYSSISSWSFAMHSFFCSSLIVSRFLFLLMQTGLLGPVSFSLTGFSWSASWA